MRTKDRLKNHSSLVIFQIRTNVKALLWIFLIVLSAVFMPPKVRISLGLVEKAA